MHPCFADLDLCSSFSGVVLFIAAIFFVPRIAIAIEKHQKERKAAEAAAKQAREEAEFQQNHPELWRQRELLKLEKERMATERQLAEKRAKQEAVSRGIGVAAGLGRFLGWW